MEIGTQTSITEQGKLTLISFLNQEPLHSSEQIQHYPQPPEQPPPQPIVTAPTPIVKNEKSWEVNLEEDDDDVKPKIRTRNPGTWRQNIRKTNKNKGLEYVKANGELCEKKKLGPPCTCKEKCFLKIGMEACQKIFHSFWKLGDHSLQNAYIAGCVRIFLPKTCQKKGVGPSRRFFSRNFQVTVNGVDTEVCKQAFLNIHSISNGRLDRLLKKKQEAGNTGFDERGKHGNKVNKIPFEKIKAVREHINGYRIRAGYTGRRKPKKVEVLPGHLNIRSMYRSYREEMLTSTIEPVCEYRYRKIFHADFHIDFVKLAPNLGQNDNSGAQSQGSEKRPAAKNSAIVKGDAFQDTTLQSMNVNVQVNAMNTQQKQDKPIQLYAEVESQNNRECTMRVQDTSYVELTQAFKGDYALSYNNASQGWIFPSQI